MTLARVRRHAVLSVLTAFASAALTLGACELLLRVTGHQPWSGDALRERLPRPAVSFHEPDAQLGWKAKTGAYTPWPGVRTTILADASRATGPAASADDRRPKLMLVGCSITQGWGLTDANTFAWKLQSAFPTMQVVNYGTAGYGTYQSLLRLERAFAEPEPPRIVVYGLIDNHEMRNVASATWLRSSAVFAKDGLVGCPYCTLDERGDLVRHPPARYPAWPLRTQLATVAFLEDIYVDATAGTRGSQGRAVTDALLLEMDRLAKSHGARLLVSLLVFTSADGKAHYVDFLRSHAIDFVDCVRPLTRDVVLPDGHPNAVVDAQYAGCIGTRLQASGWIGP